MYFSLSNIFPIVWVALAAAVVAAVWALYAGLGRARRVAAAALAGAEAPDEAAKWPGITVVVYARDNAADLEEMLPGLLAQDYPGDWEVLVVNDGKAEGVTDAVNLLSATSEAGRRLRLTFIPEEAHNLSRKKLAISLGVKGAKYPFVLLTSAVCRVGSPRWLRLMGRHFAAGREVVLGWAPMRGLERLSDRYDEVATASVWLDSALRGAPYRGTGYNLGYSRRLFNEAKGFSRSLNLHSGDDDIFIRQIATGENCAVELSADSRVEVAAFRPRSRWRDERLRHVFTSRFLPSGARRLAGSVTAALWVWLAATVVGVVFSLPNALPSCGFAAVAAGLWIPLCAGWSRCGRALGVSVSPWGAWWPMLWHWRRTLSYRLRCGSSSRKNYTWLQK